MLGFPSKAAGKWAVQNGQTTVSHSGLRRTSWNEIAEVLVTWVIGTCNLSRISPPSILFACPSCLSACHTSWKPPPEKKTTQRCLSGQILLLLASSVMERIFKMLITWFIYIKRSILENVFPSVSLLHHNIMFYPSGVLSVTPMQGTNGYRLK